MHRGDSGTLASISSPAGNPFSQQPPDVSPVSDGHQAGFPRATEHEQHGRVRPSPRPSQLTGHSWPPVLDPQCPAASPGSPLAQTTPPPLWPPGSRPPCPRAICIQYRRLLSPPQPRAPCPTSDSTVASITSRASECGSPLRAQLLGDGPGDSRQSLRDPMGAEGTLRNDHFCA